MKKAKAFLFVLAIAMAMVVLPSCQKNVVGEKMTNTKGDMSIVKDSFGKTKDGKAVEIYTLDNGKGVSAQIITYGGIMVRLNIPDRNGKSENVMLGFENVADYEAGSPHFGALIGRYGNRIAKGKFNLDGKEYTLATNDNDLNHLHGGVKGFDKVVWTAKPIVEDDMVALELNYLSKDMEEGYPGNLDVTVTYIINDKNELIFDYEATTDKPTVVNLTQHNYYNFNGGKSDILSHVLMINADRSTPVDSGLIPTGEIVSILGSPFDFTSPTVIGSRINADNEQLKFGGGYDHNWVLNKNPGEKLTLAADLYDPATGRGMKILTDEPAIQFYSGNFLDGTLTGLDGLVYKHRYGLCLETQHYPDSPNHANFPSTTLRLGNTYKTRTVQQFYTR